MTRSFFFFFSSRRRHTRCLSDWSSDVCSSDLDGQDERFAVDRNQGGKWEPLFFIQFRDTDLAFIGAEHEDFRLTVAVPVCNREIADAGQGWESFGGGERAVLLLQENRELAAFGFRDEQIGQAIAVYVSPQQAALGLVGFIERPDLKFALFESAGEWLGRLAGEFGDLCAAGILGDRNDLSFVGCLEIIGPVRADGRESEVVLRAEFAVGFLEAETEGSLVFPIDE